LIFASRAHAVLGMCIHAEVFHPRSDTEFVLMLILYPTPHQVNPNGKIIPLEYTVKRRAKGEIITYVGGLNMSTKTVQHFMQCFRPGHCHLFTP